tara:strand:+ start:3180 stop:3524 length:345 start_codon:yes stop_codon:yes gene_type:complete
MTIQTFDIEIKGKLETIEFEDDMPFGKFEQIIKKCANVSEESKLLDNVQQYRKEIVLNSLIKAPFDISLKGIETVGYKTITEIGNKILESYPLGDYLSQMMKPFEDSMPETKLS